MIDVGRAFQTLAAVAENAQPPHVGYLTRNSASFLEEEERRHLLPDTNATSLSSLER